MANEIHSAVYDAYVAKTKEITGLISENIDLSYQQLLLTDFAKISGEMSEKRAVMFASRDEAANYLSQITSENDNIRGVAVMGLCEDGSVDFRAVYSPQSHIPQELCDTCKDMNAKEYVFMEYEPTGTKENDYLFRFDDLAGAASLYPSTTLIMDEDAAQIDEIIKEQIDIKQNELESRREKIRDLVKQEAKVKQNGVEYTITGTLSGSADVAVFVSAELPKEAMNYYDSQQKNERPRMFFHYWDEITHPDRMEVSSTLQTNLIDKVDAAMETYKKALAIKEHSAEQSRKVTKKAAHARDFSRE